MESVMAAPFRRLNRLFCLHTCTLLLRSRLSRLYYTKKLNIELFPNGNKVERQARKCCRRYLSENKSGDQKYSVVLSRSPLRWFSNKMKLVLVHSFFDSDFEEETFLEGAKQAICTVSALVSQRKFSELEELLTDEAIESVKMEVNSSNNIKTFRVKMEDILQTTIYDIGFQYDEHAKGKKWLHIMVSYICQGSELPRKELGNITFIRIPLPRIRRYSFRKECTAGADDNWIITRMTNLTQDETK